MEKVGRKLRGMMPPTAAAARLAALDGLVSSLGPRRQRRGRHPNPDARKRPVAGRVHNAVRDILALDIDVASLLPCDSGLRLDNMAGVLKVSESLMKRYPCRGANDRAIAGGTPARTWARPTPSPACSKTNAVGPSVRHARGTL